MKKFIITFLTIALFAGPGDLQAQIIKGQVLELSNEKEEVAVESAGVLNLKTKKGQFTNEEGRFELAAATGDTLIVRYAGYKDDTIVHDGRAEYKIVLSEIFTRDPVVIKARRLPSWVDMVAPIQTEIITSDELGKSACCNLSESFTTNGSVEVSESDAVTGSKEIRMLGLAGRYAQVMTERRSTVRGLGYLYGLNWIPGTWIDAIQISKGTGSVTDGYESITGEINVELKKPETAERLLLNLYGNQFGRGEINLVSGIKLSPRLSTAILAHGSMNQVKWDQNNDGFLNSPLTTIATVMNRWKWEGPNNACIMFGVKGLYEDRLGGQMNFNPSLDRGTTNHYGFGMTTRRVEAFAKAGVVAKQQTWRSFGSIFNYFVHDQEAYFGLTEYKGLQHHFRGNLLWQDIIGDTRHNYKAGISFLHDNLSEQVNDTVIARRENVIGAFGEYSFKHLDKWLVVAGLRGDYNNLFGFALTPRAHMRWSPTPETAVRVSAGYGYRTPTVIAENIPVLTSSRRVVFTESIQQEKAWTVGANFVQSIDLLGREASISFDFYRTWFLNQLITDLETPSEVRFYNLRGQSFSNVAQVEATFEVLPRLDLKLAFRMQDVRATIEDSLQELPMNPRYRGLVNLSWANKSQKWQVDFTTQYTGLQRLPDTRENPEAYQLDSYVPGFVTFNAQITRKFKRLELYLGGENLGNFMQNNPIVAPDDPFGSFFDSSMIWGPLMGRQVYGGLRYSIKAKKK
jgi:outer membrane receptor for ferrienterochelin and colicins